MTARWRVIPSGEGRGLVRRLATVIAVALMIAGIQSAFILHPSTGFERFSVPIVYSMAISEKVLACFAASRQPTFPRRASFRSEAVF